MEVDDNTCRIKLPGTEWRRVDIINEKMNNTLSSTLWKNYYNRNRKKYTPIDASTHVHR